MTTAPIQWDDDAAKIQTALENLANIGKGNVTVERLTTVGTTEFAVTFVGTLRARPVPTLKVTSSLVGANPGLTVRMATVGLPGSTNAVQELTFAAGVMNGSYTLTFDEVDGGVFRMTFSGGKYRESATLLARRNMSEWTAERYAADTIWQRIQSVRVP